MLGTLDEPNPPVSDTCSIWRCCVLPVGQLVGIPGSTESHMYILTRGYADVYMNDLLIDTLVPGDSFCEAVSVNHILIISYNIMR